MLTLNEFISKVSSHERGIFTNQYVKHPDFKSLYVRYGPRYLNGHRFEAVLDIANITAKKPGKGSFARLVRKLREQYPSLVLYVEQILNPRFANKLANMGFQRSDLDTKNCPVCSMFLLPEMELKDSL